jgi:saccharopine dehydrogenase-like NADP-dependent oxidoreductase
MKNILVIGAGRSSSYLIQYLLKNSETENWKITVGDVSLELAQQKTNNHPNARVIQLDIQNSNQRQQEIQNADLIVSMLPAAMHMQVAKDCLKFKKHLTTASYVSAEMQELHNDVKNSGLVFMNEIGLDPGIDHASAMKIIEHIKENGGVLKSFKSYCGGLVAPESNDNPWGYKFSWNPRNVILAGQGTAQYIENGKYKYLPYNRLFSQIETIEIEGFGSFDAYANRDSLSYRKPYAIENIPTLLRGTLRNTGYCKAWNIFVKLGITDDTYKIVDSENMTYLQWLESYLPDGKESVREKLSQLMHDTLDNKTWEMIEFTGITANHKINISNASPAQILQKLLEEKWVLREHDKDMIVMQHIFEYTTREQEHKKLSSTLVVTGEDQTYTAMAKTVGLPLAITAKLILQNKIKNCGVLIPTTQDIYVPLLNELEQYGIVFNEKWMI